MVGGIGLEDRLSFGVKLCQGWRGREHVSQLLEGRNLRWVLVPGFVLSHKQGQWFGNLGIVLDETAVEFTRNEKLL
jgi:hypothetical protein